MIHTYILAAGEAKRMGQPKQLLPWRGKPLILHLAAEARLAALGPVTLVLGAYLDRILPVLGADQITIENPNWNLGQGSSLKTAIAHAKLHSAQAVLLAACDQPFLTCESFKRLAVGWTPGHSVISAARYSGVLGIPAIFPAEGFDELLALGDEEGARHVLRREGNPGHIRAVDLPEAAQDIDTLEDFFRFTQRPMNNAPRQ